jgi:predicted RNA-binding Zn-ribbon protein involved in translation (DUF1610 family)
MSAVNDRSTGSASGTGGAGGADARIGAGARVWKCAKCDLELVPKKTVFEYLGNTVAHEVPTCPKCGKVLIAQELAEGKMAEVEQQLEDK